MRSISGHLIFEMVKELLSDEDVFRYTYPLRGWTHFRITGKILQCHDQSPKWQPFGGFEILIGGDHL